MKLFDLGLLAILALNVLDIGASLIWLGAGAEELNPPMGALHAFSPLAFIVAKGVVVGGAVLFLAHPRVRVYSVAAWSVGLGVAAYTAVGLAHLYYWGGAA